MKRLKSVLRIVMLIFIIVLAVSGAGIFGALLPNNMRHKYQDHVIHIERVDERKDDEDEPEVKNLE